MLTLIGWNLVEEMTLLKIKIIEEYDSIIVATQIIYLVSIILYIKSILFIIVLLTMQYVQK